MGKKFFLLNDRQHIDLTHRRWAEKVPSNRNFDSPTYETPGLDNELCFMCQYYIPLQGELGMDWGVCSNSMSPFDARLMYEDDGCQHYSFAEDAPELNPDG